MSRPAAPRGTRDLFGDEVRLFRRIEERAADCFRLYGYEELRTPVFENVDLFRRAVGDTTDIVEKEMYVFEDRGGRPLALRPEGTAGVVRAYLEHAWDQSAPVKKLFYSGPMFRAERPQAGRYREFRQTGGEFFGNASPEADAETLLLMRDILAAAGLPKGAATFGVNSLGCAECRPAFRDALRAYLEPKKAGLCENCQRRLVVNPLRVLDCKGDGPALADAPVTTDHLCADCRAHHGRVLELLRAAGLPFAPAPRLVRGLDYYTRTVFEVTAPGLGAQDALGAGGRYDGLVKALGGPDTPAVGFAFGVDRVARALEAQNVPVSGPRRVFIAQTGAGTADAAFRLADELRGEGLWEAAPLAVEVGAPGKSLKSQFRAADGWGAAWVLLVGEDELKKQTVILKDLRAGAQREVPLARAAAAVLETIAAEKPS